MSEARFEVFKGDDDQWYFHLKARNGKVIAQSEGYTQKRGAVKGIESIRDCAIDSVILFLD